MGLVIPSGLSVKAYRCHKKWKENWDVLKYDSRIDSEKERNEIPKSIITSIFIMCKLSFEYHCSWNPSLCFTSWKIVNFIDKHHFLKPIFFFLRWRKVMYKVDDPTSRYRVRAGRECSWRWLGKWRRIKTSQMGGCMTGCCQVLFTCKVPIFTSVRLFSLNRRVYIRETAITQWIIP